MHDLKAFIEHRKLAQKLNKMPIGIADGLPLDARVEMLNPSRIPHTEDLKAGVKEAHSSRLMIERTGDWTYQIIQDGGVVLDVMAKMWSPAIDYLIDKDKGRYVIDEGTGKYISVGAYIYAHTAANSDSQAGLTQEVRIYL